MADHENNDALGIINAGEATEQEALLAAQLEGLGDDPAADPGAAAAAATSAGATGDDGAAAAAAAATAAEAAPAKAAGTVADAGEPPKPPRDFDADIAENQRRFDEGEIEGDEFQKQLRALSKEEAQFTARMEIYEDRRKGIEQTAAAQFNEAALSWEKAHADFMQNPLRAQQMQFAVNAIAQQQPGIAPAALFAEAAKVVFEAFGYTPKVTADDAAAAKIAAALKERDPKGVPQTLGNAPAASPIEAASGSPQFAALDALGIDDLEAALARMPKDQQEAYLRAAPGATANGH